MHAALTRCPVCAAALHVTRLHCDGCRSSIEGRFSLGRLALLAREQVAFVEAFLEARGKIKDVEQLLGISYPTVISRLDEVVKTMGLDGVPPAARNRPTERREVLEALAAGTINATEAASRLRALQDEGGR